MFELLRDDVEKYAVNSDKFKWEKNKWKYNSTKKTTNKFRLTLVKKFIINSILWNIQTRWWCYVYGFGGEAAAKKKSSVTWHSGGETLNDEY